MDKHINRPFVIVALLAGLSFPAQASAEFTFEKIAATGMQMPGSSYTFGAYAFSAPSLDGDQLAFIGAENGGHGFTAVYIVNGNAFDIIADTDTPIPGGPIPGGWGYNFCYFNGNPPQISLSGGHVAFEGKCPWSPVPDGIYTNIDGSLDDTFNPGTGGAGVRALALQADGRILIGGAFTNFGGRATGA